MLESWQRLFTSGCEILSTPRFLALWPAIPPVARQQANKTIGDNHVFMIY